MSGIDRVALLDAILEHNSNMITKVDQIKSAINALVPLSNNLQNVLNTHYAVSHTPVMVLGMQDEYAYAASALGLSTGGSKALIRGYIADGKALRVPELCSAMYIYDNSRHRFVSQPSDYTVHCSDSDGREFMTILYVQTAYDMNVNNHGALRIEYSDCPVDDIEILLFIGAHTKTQPEIKELLTHETAKSLEVIGATGTHDGDYLWSAAKSSPVTKIFIEHNLSVLTGCTFDTPSLVELYVPNSYSVPANGRGARQALRKVDISNVSVINNNAFDSAQLKDDPETSCFFINVQSIGTYAFQSCSALQTVTMGDNVQSIGTYAFQYCSALQTVTLSRELSSMTNNAFSGCSNIKTIIVPEDFHCLQNYFTNATALSGVNSDETAYWECFKDVIDNCRDLTPANQKGYWHVPSAVLTLINRDTAFVAAANAKGWYFST